MKREHIAEFFERLASQMWTGCGNHGCVINPPKGMGTNAGCKCEGYQFKREINWILREIPDRWGK